MLQSQDMGKIGFIQDLIRGVKKVVDAAKPQEAAKETVKETVVVHNEGGSNVQALLDRGQMALEDGEWSKADEFFEQVLNQDAKCGAAYLGKFLSRQKARTVQDYVQRCCKQTADSAPAKKTPACKADQAFIDACVEKYQVPGYYSASDIRAALRFDLTYCADRAAYFRDAQKQAMQRLNDDRNFTRAEKFASGEAKTQCDALRTGLTNALLQQAQKAEQAAAAEQQRITEAYHEFLRTHESEFSVRQKEALVKKRADEEAAERARIEQEAREEKERIEREAREKKERIEREKAEQEAKEKAAKADKITRIVLGVAAAVIAVVLLITKVIIPSSNYSKAEELLAAGDYDGAITALAALGEYEDSAAMRMEAVNAKEYAQAETLLAAGDVEKAAMSFGKSGSYQDAQERSMSLWDTIAVRTTLAAGKAHTAALKTNGTVIAVGNNDDGQCNVSGWTDIVAISAGSYYTVGLKADGTVVAVGNNKNRQCDVSDWTDIVAIGAAYNHTVGLKADGTVVAAGVQCDVSSWTDIVAISVGYAHIVGLKADGTVVVADNNVPTEPADRYVKGNVSDWTDIVAISLGRWHTVGLKANGSVVAVGDNSDGQCDISEWTDIVAISAGDSHTVVLKADGTVVAAGRNGDRQCSVSLWRDIVAISAGNGHTIGLKADGTVVVTGWNDDGQCNVSDWTDIKVPNK